MEKLVSLVAADLTEIGVIKSLNSSILVRLTESLACILVVESLCTNLLEVDVLKILLGNDRLTATDSQ